MELPALKDFNLVGGTALALYFGHRLSVDIDLFSTSEFDNGILADEISKNFPGFQYRNTHNPIGLFGFIDDIKVDFVRYHHYSMIQKNMEEDGIRLISLPDIAAMKVAAVLRRAVKKDFYDIAELLFHFSVQDFVNFYTNKYPGQQLLISIPFAITYFIDAEESEDPISLKGQTWPKVKKFIQQKVNEYLQ